MTNKNTYVPEEPTLASNPNLELPKAESAPAINIPVNGPEDNGEQINVTIAQEVGSLAISNRALAPVGAEPANPADIDQA